MVTVLELKETFDYTPETGVLSWSSRKRRRSDVCMYQNSTSTPEQKFAVGSKISPLIGFKKKSVYERIKDWIVG